MRNTKPFLPVKVLYWSSQISTMSIELALCIGLGYWADTKWGTTPWCLLTGCLVGFLALTWQLFRLVQSMSNSEKSEPGQHNPEEDQSNHPSKAAS